MFTRAEDETERRYTCALVSTRILSCDDPVCCCYFLEFISCQAERPLAFSETLLHRNITFNLLSDSLDGGSECPDVSRHSIAQETPATNCDRKRDSDYRC